MQGWLWAWSMDVRELVFALDVDAAGPQPWRPLARQAARRGTRVAGERAPPYEGARVRARRGRQGY